MRHIFLFLMLLCGLSLKAQSKYDLNRPFGWAECTSLTKGDSYKLTGGTGGQQITLVSDGKDMRQRIMDAIHKYDIIIFDGKGGDFIVSTSMYLDSIRNKTIVGINSARICTEYRCTKEIRHLLDSARVLELSTTSDGTIYTLSNGHKVREKREAAIRQLLIDVRHDPEENFRNSGLFSLNGAENIIFRNLTLVGPGAIDVGGNDLITASHHTKHLWVDHCEFIDGMDGNFDINSFSDFITISWCVFRYTENTYIHANTNLIGSNDNAQMNGEDNLNVTFANCIWGPGCDQRMPMVRFGTVHLMNILYECANNSAAVNPRKNSEVLIDRCFFSKGVKNIFKQSDAKSYIFFANIYTEPFTQPADKGSIDIPYKYKGVSAKILPQILHGKQGAGATLTNPLMITNH